MKQAQLFAVGSTNPAKVGAARRLLRRWFPGCRVVAVEVASGVRAQPLSLAETVEGARNRAWRALEAVAGASWGIGIEGGVEFDGQGVPWLVTVAAVVDRTGGCSVGEGGRLMLPRAFGQALRQGTELAELVERAFAQPGARTDPGAVGLLTAGGLTRRQLVAAALAAAMAPRLHPQLYGWPQGAAAG